jgi:broad specificity phosphatase PhoE
MSETTVVLVRHGRTAWHEGPRYLGSIDLPIDACGQRQAAALAAWAAGQGFSRLVCSPQVRSRATAEPIAARTGLPVRVDERLAEVDFGVAEGRTQAELRAEDPAMVERFVADPVAGHFPGGEDPASAAERGLAAIEDAVGADPGGRILVVGHNTLIRLVTCAVLGVPLREYRRRLPRLDPAAAVTLLFRDGAPPALLSFNVPVGGSCERGPDDVA